jgi:hypothetical protein
MKVRLGWPGCRLWRCRLRFVDQSRVAIGEKHPWHARLPLSAVMVAVSFAHFWNDFKQHRAGRPRFNETGCRANVDIKLVPLLSRRPASVLSTRSTA